MAVRTYQGSGLVRSSTTKKNEAAFSFPKSGRASFPDRPACFSLHSLAELTQLCPSLHVPGRVMGLP